MNRIQIYLFLLGLSIGVFLLTGGTSFSDIIVFVIFLISTLYFTFEYSVLPKGDLATKPQTHLYTKKRVSNYGNIMAGYFAFSAVIYFLLTFNFGISSSLIIFILWGLTGLLSFVLARNTSLDNLKDSITDYILIKYNFSFKKAEVLPVVVEVLSGEVQNIVLAEPEVTRIKAMVKEYLELNLRPINEDDVRKINEL